ncbi:MAG: ImmA/IrrE family metallo-endopeptidase [Clostridia bacterium]|nr:ImmA/IrrE family metallo-endopeptidase [Clostridia bacterium]
MKNTIYDKVEQLVKRYKTRDPKALAAALGIEVKYNPGFGNLKGFYYIINRKRYIVINDNLDDNEKKIVLSHEIGHDRLHRDLVTVAGLQEFVLYDMKSRPEYEANVFASELLLEDNEVAELAKEGYDIEEIAKMLETDINLAALKVSAMNGRGYNFNSVIIPKRNFLAK